MFERCCYDDSFCVKECAAPVGTKMALQSTLYLGTVSHMLHNPEAQIQLIVEADNSCFVSQDAAASNKVRQITG